MVLVETPVGHTTVEVVGLVTLLEIMYSVTFHIAVSYYLDAAANESSNLSTEDTR